MPAVLHDRRVQRNDHHRNEQLVGFMDCAQAVSDYKAGRPPSAAVTLLEFPPPGVNLRNWWSHPVSGCAVQPL